MRQSHNVNLILPMNVSIETFLDIISEVFKESDYVYENYFWNPDKNTEEFKDMILSEWHLEPIIGRDVSIEFKKREK